MRHGFHENSSFILCKTPLRKENGKMQAEKMLENCVSNKGFAFRKIF